jgi:hypothetical protein
MNKVTESQHGTCWSAGEVVRPFRARLNRRDGHDCVPALAAVAGTRNVADVDGSAYVPGEHLN